MAIGFLGQYRDSEGQLRPSEVQWPSDKVLGSKLAKLVDTYYANQADAQDARKRRAKLTQPPGRYEQVPLHLQDSPEERRVKVEAVDAEIAEIKARPSVLPDIRAAVDDQAVMDKMLKTAQERDQAAGEAYLTALDALERARGELKHTREDVANVRKLRGEDDRAARRRVPQPHVGTHSVAQVLADFRREAS